MRVNFFASHCQVFFILPHCTSVTPTTAWDSYICSQCTNSTYASCNLSFGICVLILTHPKFIVDVSKFDVTANQ